MLMKPHCPTSLPVFLTTSLTIPPLLMRSSISLQPNPYPINQSVHLGTNVSTMLILLLHPYQKGWTGESRFLWEFVRSCACLELHLSTKPFGVCLYETRHVERITAVKKMDEGCDNIWVSVRRSYCPTGWNILVAFKSAGSGQILWGD